ncbi:MAG: DUF2259 domain-containing protein [Hyphomicrobiales bacterium]
MIHLRTCVLLCVMVLLTASSGPAIAGDFAERRIIGFSPSGHHFAFEQFGIQDGSGFPYSDIFVINLKTDKWVSGTPVRVRVKSGKASLYSARSRARKKVARLLKKLKIRTPGRLLASAPVTEVGGNLHELGFRPYGFQTSSADARTVLIDVFDLPGRKTCAAFGPSSKGFALSLREDGKGKVIEVYRDTTMPKSRGCTQDYAISDIVVFPEFGRAKALVGLISVFTHGFEGADRRFLAVKLPLP